MLIRYLADERKKNSTTRSVPYSNMFMWNQEKEERTRGVC